MINRPVAVIHKFCPTVIDGILKIGGLIGFYKIFSTLIGYFHLLKFKKELEKDTAESIKHSDQFVSIDQDWKEPLNNQKVQSESLAPTVIEFQEEQRSTDIYSY